MGSTGFSYSFDLSAQSKEEAEFRADNKMLSASYLKEEIKRELVLVSCDKRDTEEKKEEKKCSPDVSLVA